MKEVMSWYKRAMPSVKDLTPFINDICRQVKELQGVKHVYAWGSYVDHINDPKYIIKDLDIIAETGFDSGDLLAIDNSKFSALKMKTAELEDMGFNPKAVLFTRGFLTLEKYNVDHWATSSDGKLLHWGAIPSNSDDWLELHIEAEGRAKKHTGLSRQQLYNNNDENRKEWKMAYDRHLKMVLSKSGGWCASEHSAEEILLKAKKM